MTKRLLLFACLLLIITTSCQSSQATPETTLPLEWSPASLTKQQIASVRSCNIENLARERYPATLKIDDLQNAFLPTTDCDWAILAMAYIHRLGTTEAEALPNTAKSAFSKAVSKNYGFALATPIFNSIFWKYLIGQSSSFCFAG